MRPVPRTRSAGGPWAAKVSSSASSVSARPSTLYSRLRSGQGRRAYASRCQSAGLGGKRVPRGRVPYWIMTARRATRMAMSTDGHVASQMYACRARRDKIKISTSRGTRGHSPVPRVPLR